MNKSNHKVSVQSGHVLVGRPDNYDVDLDTLPAVLAEMSAACARSGYSKVLLLGRSTKVNLSPLQIYDLGKKIAELNLQIAVVESHDATDEEVSFLCSVVWNRGRSIQFFDTEKEAKYWLGVS